MTIDELTTTDESKRNSFDISPLINRRMKVQPDELYTVYEVDAPREEAAAGEDEDILNYDDVDDPDAFA